MVYYNIIRHRYYISKPPKWRFLLIRHYRRSGIRSYIYAADASVGVGREFTGVRGTTIRRWLSGGGGGGVRDVTVGAASAAAVYEQRGSGP